MTREIQQRTEELIRDLVRADYMAVASKTKRRRLEADQLRDAVEEYGRDLIEPPQDWWSAYVNVIMTNDRKAALIDAPLWTRQEGRSDLTLQLRFTRASADAEFTEVEVDSLHVL